MTGLMLHCGAHHRTLDEVRAVPTPDTTRGPGSAKKQGCLHVPIPHAKLRDLVVGEIKKQTQFAVVSENYGVTDDGMKFFGLMEIQNGHNADDHRLVVGIRNSHDKTFAGGLVVGSRVFVCDNLSFSGEIKETRRHTNNIMRDLPCQITTAVAQIGNAVNFQEMRFNAYKETSLSAREADHILMNAWRENVLSSRTLGTVREEWDNPTHVEFQLRNVWSLFNNCTEAFKGKGGRLFNGIDRETLRLHDFMDRQCDLSNFDDFVLNGATETTTDNEPARTEYEGPSEIVDAEFHMVFPN